MAQILQSNSANPITEIRREEIQAAIAKAMELRAIHASLVRGSSPSNFRYPSPSPVAHHHTPQLSAHDYPVFTPNYEEEPLPGYQQMQYLDNQSSLSEFCKEYGLWGGIRNETMITDYKSANASSRKGVPSELSKLDSHVCLAEDQKSVTSTKTISLLRKSPGNEIHKSSRRKSMGDFKSVSSCSKCNPAVISSETKNTTKNNKKNSNTPVPLMNWHSSLHSQPKSRGLSFSWLFSRIKKKHKNVSSPNRMESEEVSQVMGVMSIEKMKTQLMEANESRDKALMEVGEMKSSLAELKGKLEYLERYCEELKKALRQAAVQRKTKDSQVPGMFGSLSKRGKPVFHEGDVEISMPVSEEAMVEGFLQVVSEARLSAKQFCKTLVSQIEETNSTLMENIDYLLQPYKLSLNSKYSRVVLYHLEAIINQSLYQDFENPVFQKNGSPKLLDPNQDRGAKFSSFVSLRNLSWSEVLRKGTKYYNEEFSKFCDEKMSSIISTLNWTRPWPEQLLQSFFVAAKCIWLLHLLAFSFSPPLGILRVEENRSFDPHFMEDISMDRQRPCRPSRVKIMVMPGFYVEDRVLRCKVLCRFKSVAE